MLIFSLVFKLFNLFLGCVAEMRNLGKSEQICDGVVDCPDFSDELYCPYCPEHHFHCGVGKMCVPKEKMCDGIVDCDNGADEKGCCKYTIICPSWASGITLLSVTTYRVSHLLMIF